MPGNSKNPGRVRRPAWWLALLAGVLVAGWPAPGLRAQGGQPLVAGYAIKVGASYSESFIEVTRLSDDAQATLVADGDLSPYLSWSSPPWFLGVGGLAVGVSASYNEFTASRQSFGGGPGPETTGDTASGQLVTVTPEVIYYFGRASPTQYLRLAAGVGWGLAAFSGHVQFGNTLGAEMPEPFQSPQGLTAAVSTSIEYRYKWVAVAWIAGGPAAENQVHHFKWGDSVVTLSYVFKL